MQIQRGNGIFGPWAWWSRALARWESCWDVAAVAAAVAAVTWKLGSETVLVFGPESVSDERSRHENWTILREISARVFFRKKQKIKKNHISNIWRISGTSRKHVPKIIQGSTTQPLEPSRPPPVFPGYQAIRKTRSPVFPGCQAIRKIQFPIFPGQEKIKKIKFPRFPGF